MRGWSANLAALAAAYVVVSVAGAAEPALRSLPPDRKLIEWGWDEPSPSYIRANAARMDAYGFDGVIFHAEPKRQGKPRNFAWECWGQTRFAWDDFAQDVADLKAAHNDHLRHLNENFLRFNVCPGNVDWTDDDAFAVVVANAELAGRFAKETGCKGLMFDIEQYGKDGQLFSYPKAKHRDRLSFADYGAAVRRRGQQVMEAFCRHYPDITVLLTYGYGITGVGGDRSKKSYGLLKELLDGMFDAARGDCQIVDAYEGAYSFRTNAQFVKARQSVLEGMLPHVGNRDAYRRHIRVGFGVWMDNRYGAKDWFPTDFEQNFFLPGEFEYSLFCGLLNADRYVWVYTEHLRWWQNQNLPAEYHTALRQARRPRVIEDDRYTKRRVKGWTGSEAGRPVAAKQPGYDDAATFGDLKDRRFVADLPKTWKFRTDPKLEGVAAGWWRPELDLTGWRELLIGKFWDEQGVTHTGDAWYRLAWDTPAVTVPDGAKLELWFGAVDEVATVWVNGKRVGSHDEPPDEGWDKRFAVDVTGVLQPSARNHIAVKVGNSALAGGIWKSVRLATAPVR